MNQWLTIVFLFFLCAFPKVAHAEEALPRGLFVTVLQEPPVLSSVKDINSLIDFSKKANISTLFVQIYRANQTWFPSTAGDQSPYDQIFRTMGEDPFTLLIKNAHAKGLEVHAWVNVFSLGNNYRAPILQKLGTDALTRNIAKKKSIKDYKIDNQYFLEPGDLRVREELSTIVGEILTTYPDLDGIQFDYIRYPDKNPTYGYSPANIERFKKETGQATIEDGSQIWKDWKRAQVTATLEQLVKKARSIRPQIQISTTGCMPYVRAYEEAFQDWSSWVSRGLVDFATTMSYATTSADFEKYMLDAISKSADFKKVNTAIGAHSLLETPKIFAEQIRFCESANGGSCVIFHYGSLLTAPALQDVLTGTATPSQKESP
ncbi:MAG: family 10 glycosylhydrolase [Candidatus Omnitrophica bacterium]|nr:family 10 glycosylhydrolase [Candidatus Omnitrophota bacterium]